MRHWLACGLRLRLLSPALLALAIAFIWQVSSPASAARVMPGGTGLEVGENDFRISRSGPDDNPHFNSIEAAVAYNPVNNEYFVVWSGEDHTRGLAPGESEIFGQRISGASGKLIGPSIRLSDMGPDGDFSYGAFDPGIAYNAANNEYLVVWWGDDDRAPLVDNEFEIFVQRVDAATGAEVGPNDLRVSDMGTDGATRLGAFEPAVAYNSVNNEYLVVWSGEDDAAPLVDGEYEIYAQRLDATTLEELGVNDMRISDMGTDGDVNFDAIDPAIAYNSTNNEYLVVWEGDEDYAPFVDNEYEIFGQRISGATGEEIGANDFRISSMGPDGDPSFGAFYTVVAYNSTNNEYLVAWEGDDDYEPLVDDEFEIFGQRLNAATGEKVGKDCFRISGMGPDGNPNFTAFYAGIAYNPVKNEYLVVWYGDDNEAPLVNDEFEVFGQRLDAATGEKIGEHCFRLSDMGPDGNPNFGPVNPVIAFNSGGTTEAPNNEYLIVWHGTDPVDAGFEIWGQRYYVGGANRLPGIEDPGRLEASAGVPFTFAVPAFDPDAPPQTISFSLSGAPEGMTIDAASGLIVWLPGAAQVGEHTFTVRVVDDGTPALEAAREITIEVAPLRRPTTLRIVGVRPAPGLSQAVVTAELTDQMGEGLSGRSVTFSPGAAAATTGAQGIVSAMIGLSGAGPHLIGVSFAGDAAYERSFAQTTYAQIEDDECAYALVRTSESFAASGGEGRVEIFTSVADCAWTADSSNPALAIVSGKEGLGDGVVVYNLAPNPAPAPNRSFTISVNGLTHTVLQGADFFDVPPDNIFRTFIGKLSARGVTLGCGGGNYCPDQPVTREQMAAFIIRALGDFNPPAPFAQRFIDVPPENIFYGFIEQMAVRGITLGCGGGSYCPEQPVTREQMAAFVIRALGSFNPPAPPAQRFLDVPPENSFAAFIEQMAVRGITLGCGGNNYCPEQPVTREQMAAFLVRAFGL